MLTLDDPNVTTTTTAGSWYRPGRSCQEFHGSTKFIRALVGGRGCIHGSTKIFDPTDGTSFSAADRAETGKSFHVFSLTRRGVEVCRASAPFVKGHAPLVSVGLEGGAQLILEASHKLLSFSGWTTVRDATVGLRVAFSPGPPRSSSDISRGEFFEDGRNFFQKVGDFLLSYFSGLRLGGERLLWSIGIDSNTSPVSIDVQKRSLHDFYWGELENLPKCNPIYPPFDHLSTICERDPGELLREVVESQTLSFVYERSVRRHLLSLLFQSPNDSLRGEIEATLLTDRYVQACSSSIAWRKIESIKNISEDYFYDLAVDGAGTYWAEGAWHKNSGKTTTVAVEVVGHCWHNPGAKVLLLRKTELSQDETTIDTFNMVYENMGSAYQMTETSLFHTWDDGRIVRLPSEEAVRRYNDFKLTNPTKAATMIWLDTEGAKWCSWLYFRGIPDEAKRGNKLRGYECSLAVFIEADLMELGDFTLLLPCLRWKNAYGEFITEDAGVIIDTNPPSPRHWIAKLEESCDKTMYQFWHISTYENQHNLPPQYIERNILLPYADNPAMVQRMLYGQYAEAFDGQAVLSSFRIGVHAGEDLAFPLHAYLVRGWDFGNVNAVVWSAYWPQQFLGDKPEETVTCEYWWDLHEMYQTSSDVDQQCQSVLKITTEQFPFWNDRSICSGILDFCDPAGAAKKDTGSSIAVLNTYGIYPGYKFKDRGVPKTVAIYNRLLAMKDRRGFYVYRIDKKNCPVLFAASTGGYRYPKESEPGFGSGVPLKDGFFDHVCFSPNTRVLLKRGWTFIRDVTTEDRAWTRSGWRRVIKVAETASLARRYRAVFSDGNTFIATGDHPIWVQEDYRFIPLLQVTQRDSLHGCPDWSSKSLMQRGTTRVEHIFDQLQHRVPTCIETYGNFLMDPFPHGFMFTIAMVIRRIIRSKIWSVFLVKSMGSVQKISIGQRCLNILLKFDQKQPSGTVQNLDVNGIRTMRFEQNSEREIQSRSTVNSVEIHTLPLIQLQSFALISVNRPSVGKMAWTWLFNRVRGAAEILKYLDMGTVRKPVQLVTLEEVDAGPVWNMTVEGEHEYFAEGILVSNCDAARYAKINALRLAEMEVEAPTAPAGVLAVRTNVNPLRRY